MRGLELFPVEYVKSMADYGFEAAYAAGKRLVLYDIDNTLVPHGYPCDGASAALFKRLKAMGFKFCAVSNNHEERVKSFCDAAGSPYVCDAGKPSKKGYLRALSLLKGEAGEAVFFGDQIFTDIWGANAAGIHSVLVRPVDKSTDEIQIRFKRHLEKPFIKAFFRSKNLAIDDYFG